MEAGRRERGHRSHACQGPREALPTLAPLCIAGLLASALFAAFPTEAGETLAGPIPARITQVVDGDTIEVTARIWLGQELTVRVRLDGADAPELKGGCARERALAVRARTFLAEAAGSDVRLSAIQHDKYGGRVIARVTGADGRDLGVALIEAGLAYAYNGGARLPWCETARR
jgi:endonuclease YncB( thermonuclease family)